MARNNRRGRGGATAPRNRPAVQRDPNVVELESPIDRGVHDAGVTEMSRDIDELALLPSMVRRTHVKVHFRSNSNFTVRVSAPNGRTRTVFGASYTSTWIPIEDYQTIVCKFVTPVPDGEDADEVTYTIWYELRGYRSE